MEALSLVCDLVAVPSISKLTNSDAADVVESALSGDGFETERLQYTDPNGVRKVSIVGRKGTGKGGLAYFAHTDVVPADTWSIAAHGPFSPTVRDGRLYGRGSCDMKGSLGAFVAAASRIPAKELTCPVYVIATADEEIGFHGAKDVVERSELYRELVQGGARAIVGEPTELQVVYAHKGGYGQRITSRGRAAHSSTREGINANLAMIPFLAEMKQIYEETLTDPAWLNNEFEPPWISWNIGI
ncbi:MAG: acetylornithine deacetylase, partial [Planctomycetales bacterium 12-60-4]